MNVKIRGGTVNHGEPSLCETCRHATIVRGRSVGEEIVLCKHDYPSWRVPFVVATCSEHSDRRVPTVEALEKIAWDLPSKSGGRTVGLLAGRLPGVVRHPVEDEE